MSIAFESGGGSGIERSGFVHGMSCISIFDSPEAGVFAGDRRFPSGVEEREEGLDSCSSSSIGRNSDASGGSSEGEDSGETEVQSSYKGPLETMDALEDVLVVKKSISKFYNGKSKSFTSLADVSASSSVKDLAKPENAYAKKRKNLLAYSNFWDKNRNCPWRSNAGGISKRPLISSRSTLALAVTMSSSESGNYCEDSNCSSNLSSSHSPSLPPLHPQAKKSSNNAPSSSPPSQQKFPPWRSFSLSDLQGMDAATPGITELAGNNNRERDNELQH